MWALVESNTVTKVFTQPKALTIGDIQHPKDIFELWSESDLNDLGIYTVEIDNTNLKDSDYYTNTGQSFNFANGKVTASYGTATAKSLTDTSEEDRGVTTTILGLKNVHKDLSLIHI